MTFLAKTFDVGTEAGAELRRAHGRLKGVHEFLADAVEAAGGDEGVDALSKTIASLVPWAGFAVQAVGEALPPVKFLLMLFEKATAVDDPDALGYLACTLAYQRAVQQAVTAVAGQAPPSDRTR